MPIPWFYVGIPNIHHGNRGCLGGWDAQVPDPGVPLRRLAPGGGGTSWSKVVYHVSPLKGGS